MLANRLPNEDRDRSYFPDFIVNGKIVEIKRNIDKIPNIEKINIIKTKEKFSKELWGENYCLIEKKDFPKNYLFFRRKKVHLYEYKIEFTNEIKK